MPGESALRLQLKAIARDLIHKLAHQSLFLKQSSARTRKLPETNSPRQSQHVLAHQSTVERPRRPTPRWAQCNVHNSADTPCKKLNTQARNCGIGDRGGNRPNACPMTRAHQNPESTHCSHPMLLPRRESHIQCQGPELHIAQETLLLFTRPSCSLTQDSMQILASSRDASHTPNLLNSTSLNRSQCPQSHNF